MPIVDVEGTEIEFPDDMTDQEIDYRIRSQVLPQLDRERAQETLAPGALYGDLPAIPAREPQEPPGQGEAFLRGGAQGLTLGFADELAGLGQALRPAFAEGQYAPLDDPSKPTGLAARYRMARDISRGRHQRAREEHPATYTTGEVAGGLATGVAGAGRTVAGQTLRQALPRLAATGAATGGAAGAGYSEAETVPELAGDVATGAAVGAVAAPAITGAGVGIRQAVTGGWKRVRQGAEAFQRGRAGELTAEGLRVTKNRAVQEVADALEADEIDPARLNEIFQANPSLVLGDLGANLQRKLGAVSRQPTVAAQQIAQQMESRNIDQLDRLAPVLQKALGGTDVITALKNSVQRTKAQAAPLYDEAYAGRIRGTATLQKIMQTDAAKEALPEAQKTLRSVDIDPTKPENSVQLFDHVIRALDGQRQKLLRGGDAYVAGRVGDIRKRLYTEVNRQVPALGAARRIAADEFANRDALDLGKAIFREETPALRQAVGDMSVSEREHLRIGVFDAVMNRLRSKSETANLVQDFKKPKVRDAIELAFNNPQQFANFRRVLGDEQKMFETMAQVLRGSPTAERVQADRALQQGVDAATDVITGTPQSLLRRAASRATEAFTGGRDTAQQRLSQETIADLLTRRPGAAELAPIPAPVPPPVAPQAISPLLPGTALPTTEQILQGLLTQ